MLNAQTQRRVGAWEEITNLSSHSISIYYSSTDYVKVYATVSSYSLSSIHSNIQVNFKSDHQSPHISCLFTQECETVFLIIVNSHHIKYTTYCFVFHFDLQCFNSIPYS